jgi:hypothetical protein
VSGEPLAGGGLPRGREIRRRLDAAVAASGDQLGQHVGDFLGSASVVTPLLALAAGGEVRGGNGVLGRVNNVLSKRVALPWLNSLNDLAPAA